jgi:Na+/glutamate symporter
LKTPVEEQRNELAEIFGCLGAFAGAFLSGGLAMTITAFKVGFLAAVAAGFGAAMVGLVFGGLMGLIFGVWCHGKEQQGWRDKSR